MSCPEVYGAPCDLAAGHDGPHGFNDKNARGGRWQWTTEEGRDFRERTKAAREWLREARLLREEGKA